MTPKLTASGKNLLLRAMAGESLTFTKIQLGNGPWQEPINATALNNPLVTAEYSKIELGSEYVSLTASFTNGSVTDGFRVTEVGFFAQDPDNSTKDVLYAIGHENESSADFIPDKSNRITEMQFSAMIFIGDAENVSAAISSSLVYASKDSFDEHVNNTENPHGVTKEQISLGNVQNLAPSDMAPVFADSVTTSENIKSGEKLSTLFAKIRGAIDTFKNHIANKYNPHNTTAAQVGAASSYHTHSTADINKGVLPVERGGTGTDSTSGLISTLWQQDEGFGKVVTGTYKGTGVCGPSAVNSLTFSSPPKFLAVMLDDISGGACDGFSIVRSVTTVRNYMGPNPVTLYFSWPTNEVQWFVRDNNTESGIRAQQNIKNKTYRYFAIL